MQYFLLFFKPGPQWLEGKSVFEQPLDEHVDYINQLYTCSTVLLAGPLHDGSGGLTIVQCDSAEEAERLGASDPAVQRGILAIEVRQWRPIAWGYEPGAAVTYERDVLQITRATQHRAAE